MQNDNITWVTCEEHGFVFGRIKNSFYMHIACVSEMIYYAISTDDNNQNTGNNNNQNNTGGGSWVAQVKL